MCFEQGSGRGVFFEGGLLVVEDDVIDTVSFHDFEKRNQI